jgi:hypothetical protein
MIGPTRREAMASQVLGFGLSQIGQIAVSVKDVDDGEHNLLGLMSEARPR